MLDKGYIVLVVVPSKEGEDRIFFCQDKRFMLCSDIFHSLSIVYLILLGSVNLKVIAYASITCINLKVATAGMNVLYWYLMNLK